MGLTGEQSLSFHQNKTLVESKESGVILYLFEVFEEGHYVYIGVVELSDLPYLSRQPDIEKNIRDVYIFPLKLKGNKHPPLLKKELLETKEEIVRKKAHKLPLDELEFKARYAVKEGGKREVVTNVYERDQIVSEYAKRKANGICQLCNQPAPFLNPDGEPHLETHHIEWLSKDGKDIIENTVALCPNCHRKMHVLNLPADVAILKNKNSSNV
jgi:5-methylcytosine-specific restriction protein A